MKSMLQKKFVAITFLTLFSIFSFSTAGAITYTLTDDNSTANIDPNSNALMTDWVVDGVDNLYTQTFLYRIGEGSQNYLSSAFLENVNPVDFDGDGDVDALQMRYILEEMFEVEVRYSLQGTAPGSLASDIAEQISVVNISDTTLDFSFFQYSDFDLNGTSFDQTITLENANTISQSGGGLRFNETVATPGPDHWEIAEWREILNYLESGTNLDLRDQNSMVGPGDATWAFQWDRQLAAGGAFTISKDKRIAPIPEPATMILLGIGLIGLGTFGRKKGLFSKTA